MLRHVALIVLLISQTLLAADEKPAFAGPPPAEQLKVLAPLAGKWKSESTVKPSIRTREGFVAKGEVTSQWILNGHFLEQKGFMTNPNGRYEISALIGFDRQTGKLVRIACDSNGLLIEAVGEWDEAGRSITWKTTNAPPGWTSTATLKLESDDKITFSGKATNDKGEVVNEFVSVSERIKAEK